MQLKSINSKNPMRYMNNTLNCLSCTNEKQTVHCIQEDDTRSPYHSKPVPYLSRTRKVQEKPPSRSHYTEQFQELPRTKALVTEEAGTAALQASRGQIHSVGFKQVGKMRHKIFDFSFDLGRSACCIM